jgi:hypothetical protein
MSSAAPATPEVIDNPSAGAGPAGRESGGGVLGVASDAGQLDLLRDEDGKLPSNVFALVRQEPELARKPGRPAGARNKRDAALEHLIEHKYGNPVEFQASIYAMPLDQLCELLLIADGTIARREKLDGLLVDMAARVRELAALRKAQGERDDSGSIERLAEACEALESVARTSAGKPGDVAIKALNLQLAAARTVSEYTNSKKPTEHKIELDKIPTLVMPGFAAPGVDFAQQDQVTRFAGEMLAKALSQGRIAPQDIVGLQLVDNRFVMEGEAVEIDDTPPDSEGEDA